MEIDITDQQKKLPLQAKSIKTIVRAILRHLQISDAKLSFVFVTSQKIRALNIKYLNRSHTTDVLAFDWSVEKVPLDDLQGEIIISTDAVIQNSRRFQSTPASELVLYIVHGILHLMGYDDHSARDVADMRAKEEEVMQSLQKRIATALQT